MVEQAHERPSTAMTQPVAKLVASPPVGSPLRRPVRTSLERSLGVNLESVRVHDDARTGKVVDNIPARAFAYGTHIYLGSQEQASNLGLMGHEAAHVVQQRGGAQPQAYADRRPSGGLEGEAARAGRAVASGERFAVRGRTEGPQIQGGFTEWLEEKAWDIVNEVAPDLAPILRKGLLTWLEEQITTAIGTLIETLMRPVRAVQSTIDAVREHFASLVIWIQEAAARIAEGDCGAITEAATKIEHVIRGFAAPVVNRISAAAKRVGEFFTSLWDRFGAPAWDFLKRVGGAVWDRIQRLGTWIWEKTAPIRDLAARAWRWVKNKLGIGEGAEGQNGLLQWVQEKAGAAWDRIKGWIEPIKKPLMVVAGVLVMLSPAGPFVAIGAAAVGLYRAVSWIRANLARPGGVVQQRETLRTTIIPAIMGAVNRVTGTLTELAAGISGTLGAVVGGLGDMVGAFAGSFLSFAVNAVQWIATQITRLAEWASTQVTRLVGFVSRALSRLSDFMQPVLGVLGKIVTIVGNAMQIPILFAGRVWNLIPACIRNPIVNFLVNHLLRHIPIFGELLADPEVWGKLREGATRLVRQIFRDHDLRGAIRSAFELILTVFKVPVELVRAVYAKAKGAWEHIYRRPLDFLRNLLRAMKGGFSGFFTRIWTHLGNGLVQWLMGQLRDVNVRWPGDLSLRSVLGLVSDLLGLTVEKIFERLARKIGQERVAKLRRALDKLTGALGWIADLIREGPAGLWKNLMDRVGNLWETVKDAISNWVVTRIVTSVSKRLLSMLDPTGVMAVVNSLIAIYDTIKWAVAYARQILEFVGSVLDAVLGIATGAIGPAAKFLEDALGRAVPIAIAFLAQHAGFAKLGARIRETVETIRKKIDGAIDWLIDKTVTAGRALLERIGLGGPTGTPEERLHSALVAAKNAVSRFNGRFARAAVLRPILAVVKRRYSLTSLELVQENDYWTIVGILNPKGSIKSEVKAQKPKAKKLRPTAKYGDINVYSKQGRAIWDEGERMSEHEHIRARINLELMTRDPITGESPYDKAAYRRSATLTIPEDMARVKTREDLALRDRLKAAPSNQKVDDSLARELNLEADIRRTTEARDAVIQTRKAAGKPITDLEAITDDKIIDAARRQQDELFEVGKSQRLPARDEPMDEDDEIDEAFSSWAEL